MPKFFTVANFKYFFKDYEASGLAKESKIN